MTTQQHNISQAIPQAAPQTSSSMELYRESPAVIIQPRKPGEGVEDFLHRHGDDLRILGES